MCQQTCRAGLDGGGVLLTSNDATYTSMNACSITSNYAGADGGGMTVVGSATVLANTTFADNSAGGQGGALMYTQQCFLPGVSALDSCAAHNLSVLKDDISMILSLISTRVARLSP